MAKRRQQQFVRTQPIGSEATPATIAAVREEIDRLYRLLSQVSTDAATTAAVVPAQGAQGLQGVPGLGFPGADGEPGLFIPGIAGATGAAGAAGAAGRDGAPAILGDCCDDDLVMLPPPRDAIVDVLARLGPYTLFDRHVLMAVAGQSRDTTSYNVEGIVGLGALTVASAGAASKVAKSDNMYCNFATAAAASATNGWRAVFTLINRQHNPEMVTLVRSPGTLTSVRLWIGLTSAQMTDSDTAPGHFMGFRFSSVAGDTGWTPITRDGTTQTAGTTIGTVVADTAYKLKIRAQGGSVFFSVNDGAEQAIAANLPGSTQDLGPDHRVITQANAVRDFCFGRMIIRMGTSIP